MSEGSKFFIVTDSSCDLPQWLLDTYKDFALCPLTFTIDGEVNPDLDNKAFYDRLRNGSRSKTSQVTPGAFLEVFRKAANDGMDVLYVGFSSGLSGTVESGFTAAEIVGREFPERKFVVIDTLSASCGEGCLVDKAVELRDSGKTLEETAAWIEQNKLNLHHWYTVDDLHLIFLVMSDDVCEHRVVYRARAETAAGAKQQRTVVKAELAAAFRLV